jgi:transcriptional regulator with XRE-family HTH domain
MALMPEAPFSQALKAAREAAGLSQSALARRAGLTPSYLSLLESKKKRPPLPRVVTAICRALGIDETPLQEAAALERTPTPVRRRLLHLTRERHTVARARDRLLCSTLFHLSQRPVVFEPLVQHLGLSGDERGLLDQLLGRARRATTPHEAERLSEDILADAPDRARDRLVQVLPGAIAGTGMSAPPTPPAMRRLIVLDAPDGEEPLEGDGLELPASIAPPGAVLWRADTEDGWPRVEPGDLLVLDRDANPSDGDFVVLREGGVVRLRLQASHGSEVRLMAVRPEVPPIRLPRDRYSPLGLVSWILRRVR